MTLRLVAPDSRGARAQGFYIRIVELPDDVGLKRDKMSGSINK
jgi:hypothetical protein